MTTTSNVTRLLNAASEGDEAAREELYARVYDELLTLARSRLRREPKLRGKEPESLVHQVYLKFSASEPDHWLDRRQFYGYARRAMWQICVDEIRRGTLPVSDHPLSQWMVELREDPADMVAIEAALEKLRALDPRVAEVVVMRRIEGRSVKETAALLNVADRTVESDWAHGRAWLRRELSHQ